MSLGNIPPPGRHSKPKSKGKKPAAPKLKASPGVDPLDVFEVALSADAGADSRSQNAFSAYINQLSKGQMGHLEKLVKRITKKVFKTQKEKQRHMDACKKIRDAIDKRSEQAAEAEIELELIIKEKLEDLPISEIECPQSGKVKAVFVANKWVSIAKFVNRYFKQEIEHVQEALNQGLLIRQRIRQRPHAFVEKVVQSYLKMTRG